MKNISVDERGGILDKEITKTSSLKLNCILIKQLTKSYDALKL